MMTTLTNQEVLAELYYTAKAIKFVTGVTPLHWRPVSLFSNTHTHTHKLYSVSNPIIGFR